MPSLKNAPFLVLTQNIRYADDMNGNSFDERAPRYNKLVTEYMPDLIYMQEDSNRWSIMSDAYFGKIHGVSGLR